MADVITDIIDYLLEPLTQGHGIVPLCEQQVDDRGIN